MRSTDLTKLELTTVVLLALKEEYEKHGGPAQVLDARYPDARTKMEFAKKLYSYFPPSATENTKFDTKIGSGPEQLVLHLAMFAWDEESSARELTSRKTSMALAEHFMLDTFIITSTEPIRTSIGFGSVSDKQEIRITH